MIQGVSTKEAYKDMPKELIAYFKSLPEYDEEIFNDITGCNDDELVCSLQLLKETHPKFYNLLHILKNNGVTYAEAIDWINEHGNMNIKY